MSPLVGDEVEDVLEGLVEIEDEDVFLHDNRGLASLHDCLRTLCRYDSSFLCHVLSLHLLMVELGVSDSLAL